MSDALDVDVAQFLPHNPPELAVKKGAGHMAIGHRVGPRPPRQNL